MRYNSSKIEFLCPYCFEINELADVVYHCINCNEDTLLQKTITYHRSDYTIPTSGTCHVCKKIALPSCPDCKGRLPEGTLFGEDTIISIVGAVGSGKSHYIAVLIHELRKRIAASFGGTFNSFGGSNRLWYQKYGQLYCRNPQVIEKTVMADKTILDKPLIYELVLPTETGKNRMFTFVFFDTAGENFEDEEQMSILNKYIYRSSGIICLLDPFRIPDLADRIRNSNPETFAGSSSQTTETASNVEIVHNVSNLIRSYREIRQIEKVDIPVAIVLSKLDAIINYIPRESIVLDNSPNFGVVDMNDIHNIDSEIEALLNEWNEQSFLLQVKTDYKKISYFAVSALGFGNHPDAGCNRILMKPRPHRIEDPFLWILKENGIFDRQKKNVSKNKKPELKLISQSLTQAVQTGSQKQITFKAPCIKWMQLSDLHFYESAIQNLQKNFLEKMKDISFVIVTGDLKEYHDNYDQTIAFLSNLSTNLSNSMDSNEENIFFVPGNHDIDKLDTNNITAKKRTESIESITNQIWNDPDCYFNHLDNLTCVYSEFLGMSNAVLGNSTYFLNDIPFCMRQWNDKLNILHINTSLLCTEDKSIEQIVDTRGLSDKKRFISNSLPTIIIMHHDFYALYQAHQDILKRIMVELSVVACLSGHIHKTSSRIIRLPNGKEIPNFVCGKTLGQPGDHGSDNSYVIYEWDQINNNVIATPYQWSKSNSRFEPSFNFNNDEEVNKNIHGFSFQLKDIVSKNGIIEI